MHLYKYNYQETFILDLTLVQVTHAPVQMEQALRDLDILRILCFANPQFSQTQASKWMEKYFTSDSEEITARSAVMTDLFASCDSETFSNAIIAVAMIREEADKLGRSLDRLHQVLYSWRRLRAYLSCLDIFSSIFLEKEYLSPRIIALKDLFVSLQKDPIVASCRNALTEMDSLLQLPAHLYLGINVKEDGTPLEFGILGEALEEEPINALICPKDHNATTNSMCPEFFYNSSLYGSHFDEYFSHALEKKWRSSLAKAKKLLDEITLPHIEDILSLEVPLQFYLVGMRCAEAYTSRGYSLCRPEIHAGGGFFAKNLKYPELVLHQSNIQGNDISLRSLDAIIITGANHSGKTSYLKTLGQTYLLSQLGFFVPADSVTLTPVTGMHTLFSAGEDDSMDASRMGVEIKKLTAILNNAVSTDLVLLNEPMTSTNPVEAVSICADISKHLLKKGITHLLVTHLYDIYFLLHAQLGEDLKYLRSLITESYYDDTTQGMVHHYRLREAEPEGNSYARETARSFGITLEDMVVDVAHQAQAAAFCDSRNDNQVYEKKEEC